MGLYLYICVLSATAMPGDKGESFSLSLKVDGRYPGRCPCIQSEVVSLGNIVWLPKIIHATGGMKNVFNVQVDESSSLTFELRRNSDSPVSSLAQTPIACFSTTADDMFSQRKSSSGLDVMQLTESGPDGGDRARSRLLHVYWEIWQHPTRAKFGVHHCDRMPQNQPSSVIYSEMLLGFGRGTPLWVPGCPLSSATQSYKRNGIGIGDVGIIMPHGIFQYHFNIFHAPGHAENPADLPDELLCPGGVPDFIEFDQGSEILDNHIQGTATCTGIDSPTPEYTMCASKWAILGIPNGSKSRYAVNLQIFSKYLEMRGEAVYKYLLEKRGIGLKNGELCVATGWTKANSWGMAAFANPYPQLRPCTVKFCENAETPRIPQYRWHCFGGSARMQSGPRLPEIQMLREESEDEMDVQQRVNQCLFVKTISVTVQGNRWSNILRETGCSRGFYNRAETKNSKVYCDCNRLIPGRPKSSLLSGFGGPYYGYWFDIEDRNPSRAIGRCLLAMTPSAKSSISSDMDWTPISQEKRAFLSTSEPNIPYILARLLELNEICQEDGNVRLRPRDIDIPNIRVYINSAIPGLSAKIQAKTSYSKLTFVDKLDHADIWILERDGRLHGRIVHWLSFRHTPESLLQAAFMQILPFFRLMLQLGGILQIYVQDHSLLNELEAPTLTWYSLSKDGCSICDQAMIGSTVKHTDFGGRLPDEQKILPLGRDAFNVLSRHFNCLWDSLRS